MTENEFKSKFAQYGNFFNGLLTGFCETLDCKPQILADSIKYSLLLGGKRIRPVLMLAVGDLLGIEREKLCGFALAIELIHTYSLIHDDLPEMDNDDYRRGKLSNHKVFGAGNAVLAGDGLLNTAYSLLFDQCRNGSEYVSAAKFICDCAGIYGMIAGQSADLLHENDGNPDEETIDFIYENKTAKLICAAVATPAILSGGKYFAGLDTFGRDLGYLFQLTDDILDVEGDFSKLGKSIGKDEKEGKSTYISVYGLEKCKLRADFIAQRCRGVLEGLDGDREFLLSFVDFVRARSN